MISAKYISKYDEEPKVETRLTTNNSIEEMYEFRAILAELIQELREDAALRDIMTSFGTQEIQQLIDILL